MMRNKRRAGALLLAAALLMSQAACMNLAGLRKFTEESVKAGLKFKALSQDPYRSCASELYYQKLKSGSFVRPGATAGDASTIAVFDTPAAFLATVAPEQRRACEELKTNWGHFRSANKVLMTYLYVMGTLAADEVASTDDEFGSVKSSLSGIPGGANPILGAALNLANTLTNAILDGKRRRAIRRAVTSGNGDIAAIADGLSNGLLVYEEQLRREKAMMQEAYAFALAAHKKFNAGAGAGADAYDPFLALSNGRNLEAEVQVINAKIKASEAYREVLSGIKRGHQELYAEAQQGFSQKNVVRIALKYAPAIQSNYDELAKVF